jgi:propanediol utilization protein
VVTPPVLGTNDTLPVSTQVADDAQAYAAGGTVLLVTSWTAVSDSSLQFQLYGQVKRPTDVGLSRSDAVALSLSLGALPGTVHRGGGVLPGSPVVTTVAPTQEPTGVVGTLLDRIGGILSGLTLRGGW